MQRTIKSRVVALLAMIMITITTLFGSLFVNAGYTTGADALGTLKATLATGSYTYKAGGKVYDFAANRYKVSGGGYFLYTELINTAAVAGSAGAGLDYFNSTNFEQLTSGAKQDFLGDVFTIANAIAADSAKGYNTGTTAPTDDTVADLMQIISQQSGMGSSMLAMIMQNTKPDYVTANRIYEPFSGVVGTILGIVSILIMALLGVTMALDLAYITIPTFQMALGGEDEGGNKKGGLSGVISKEAKAACKAADGGAGGQGGDGSYKAAVGIYFKYRWKGLVLLGVCLLYLVQGQIYSFVGWLIDLFSGFLGF